MNSDHELFRSIYVHYRPLLRTAAKRKGIPYDELDDIVQETFEAYYSRYPLDWSEYQIRKMLMKILTCRCADYLRKQSRIPVTYLDPAHIEEGDLETGKTEGKDILEVLLEEQKYQKIMDVLSSMKSDWSEVFIKLTIEGRSVAEVSRELGITEAACRTRLSRANKYLRAQLSGYQPMVMKRSGKEKTGKHPEEISSKEIFSEEISPEAVSPKEPPPKESPPGSRSVGIHRECLS